MYENHSKICISAFCFCILAYVLSPWKDMSVRIEEVSAKEVQTATGKTATGISLEIQTWGKEDSKKEWKWNNGATHKKNEMSSWPNATGSCDAECKISELIKKGIRDEIARSLVVNCKELAIDPVHCIKYGASIAKNESSWWNKCKTSNKYNCMGLNVKADYKSYSDWVLHWVGKYNKHWFKAQNMGFFYSPTWSLPRSRFCVSEHSSNTSIGCPHGLKISTQFFNSLSF